MFFSISKISCFCNGIILPCTGATNEEASLGRYNGTPNKKVKGIDGKESTIKVNEFNIKVSGTPVKLNG